MKKAPLPLPDAQPVCYNGGRKGAFCMKKAWPVLLALWPYAGLGLLW